MVVMTIDEVIACGIILAGFMAVLGIGCLIADYVLPRILFVKRFFDTIPEWDDKE